MRLYVERGTCKMSVETMNVVIVGHVDHGKSTVIGRLLADTGSLPDGKLEQVKATCAKNAKPFEYAFLLDALKDEQAQGITIDSARCFFHTPKRHYIVIDAPGHIEFLKNMVTGAANAEAAAIVIDSKEGVQENSRRHGYLVSMLGIKQVFVLVNKMDLVDYDEKVFNSIVKEYSNFLAELNVKPVNFVPISAFNGENIATKSEKTPWYEGLSVIDQFDALQKESLSDKHDLPFRFPVQDVYKFTEEGDDRRIFAGTVSTGTVSKGDKVVFLPSGKRTAIRSVERFNATDNQSAASGESVGFTIDLQLYIKPGELMVREDQVQPHTCQRFRANIFWMGHAPLIKNKTYKLKVLTKQIIVKLVDVVNVIDASEINSVQNKQQVDRHDVGECIFETTKPISFDLAADIPDTGRFVVVDNYEISGGGIILEAYDTDETLIQEQADSRNQSWVDGLVSSQERSNNYQHKPQFVIFTGELLVGKRAIAMELEKLLLENSIKSYYLSSYNLNLGLDNDIQDNLKLEDDRSEHVRRLGELGNIMTKAGLVFLTSFTDADDYELKDIEKLSNVKDIFIVHVGENNFSDIRPDVLLSANPDEHSAAKTILEKLLPKIK